MMKGGIIMFGLLGLVFGKIHVHRKLAGIYYMKYYSLKNEWKGGNIL